MRTTALAIALMLSGAAVAQTYPDTNTGADAQADATTEADVTTDADAVDADAVNDATVQPDSTTDTSAQTDATGTTHTGHTATTTDTGVSAQTDTSVTTQTTTGDTGVTGQTTMAANIAPASGPVVQPSNAAPERDMRGIAVISDPAFVPTGWNGMTSGVAMGGPLVDPATGQTAEAADASYPACTAQITDNCVQTYERGVRG